MIAETTAWAKARESLYELLIDIYVEFGPHNEKLVNVVKKGKRGR